MAGRFVGRFRCFDHPGPGRSRIVALDAGGKSDPRKSFGDLTVEALEKLLANPLSAARSQRDHERLIAEVNRKNAEFWRGVRR